MRGTTTSTSTAMMTIRTRKNMSRSFQRPRGNWLPSALIPGACYQHTLELKN
jgi:hypothetical protein